MDAGGSAAATAAIVSNTFDSPAPIQIRPLQASMRGEIQSAEQ